MIFFMLKFLFENRNYLSTNFTLHTSHFTLFVDICTKKEDEENRRPNRRWNEPGEWYKNLS